MPVGTRRLGMLASMVAATSISACGLFEGEVTYKPAYVPIELKADTTGKFGVSMGKEIITSIGVFEVGAGIEAEVDDDHTMLVVRSAGRDEVFDINEKGPLTICLDGRFQETVEERKITVAPSDQSRIGVIAGTSPDACKVFQPPPALEATMPDLSGTWRGTYTCRQGETGMILTMTARSATTYDVEMHFYAIAANPDVPDGTTHQNGIVTQDGDLYLQGDYWIDRPGPTWQVVDMRGAIFPSDGKLTYAGDVLTKGCGGFRAEKVD